VAEGESDRALAERLKANDAAAWGEASNRYGERLVGAGLKLLKDPREAVIKAHEAIARAWEIRERIDVEAPILAWLLTIQRNLILHYLRARAIRDRVDQPPLGLSEESEEDPGRSVARVEAEKAGDPEQTTSRGEEREIVQERMAALRPEQREAVMAQLEGLTLQDIADEMGVNRERVKTLLRTGLKALRNPCRTPTIRTCRP